MYFCPMLQIRSFVILVNLCKRSSNNCCMNAESSSHSYSTGWLEFASEHKGAKHLFVIIESICTEESHKQPTYKVCRTLPVFFILGDETTHVLRMQTSCLKQAWPAERLAVVSSDNPQYVKDVKKLYCTVELFCKSGVATLKDSYTNMLDWCRCIHPRGHLESNAVEM